MKYILVFLILLSNFVSAQKIIISGKEGNRPLTWADFAGKPDNGNSFFAMTYWSVDFQTADIKAEGNKLLIGSFIVKLQFDPVNSWVKKGKESAELLEHEQHHFDIGILCMRELLLKEKQTVFTKANIGQQLQALFSDTMKKYKEMELQYDEETDHSRNKEEQQKWNLRIAEELAK